MLKILVLVVASVLSITAGAQPAVPAPADPSVYQAFGERAGLVRLTDDFMRRIEADSRLGPQFSRSDKEHIKAQLVDQFCQLTGGGCAYKGADMKSAHANLDIAKADFNRLVEVLQDAMDAQGVPFPAQRQLLARLAPMHRDVITLP